jgi:type I restriction enzyme, S subunit
MTFKKLVMSSFIQKKWADVCTLEYGKGIRDYKNEDNDYSVYGSAGKVGTHSEFHLEKGVIVSRKGTLGVHYSDAPFFVIDTAFFLKPKPELNAKWAYYALKNFDIKKLTSGTGVPSLSRNEFYAEDLLLPPIDDQNKVESILSRLDEKIELNQKMNETLEEIAKTLFKSWFIDFDPVRAKAEGRPTGLSKEISDLFPDSFEDSELGQIPSGWKISNLGDKSFEIESGKRPKGGINKELKTGIPSVGAESISSIGTFDYSKEKFVTYKFYETCLKGRVKNNDVALYKDGGKPGLFMPRVAIYGEGFPYKKFLVNEHVFLLRSTELGQFFLYHLINSSFMMNQIIEKGSAKAAQPGLNQEEVKSCKFISPSTNLIDEFNKIINPSIKKQLILGTQSNTLENLRDTVLPKLISGELRIPDAENLIKEAGN